MQGKWSRDIRSIFLAVRIISGGRTLAVAVGTELDKAARAGGDGLVTVFHIWGSPQEDIQGGHQQAPPSWRGARLVCWPVNSAVK